MSAVSSPVRSSSYENNSKKTIGGNGTSTSRRRQTRSSTEEAAAAAETNDNSNLVKLCINKPKSWNWELTTSKSSPSIAFPVIQLYERSSGALLAETNEADCQIRGKGSERESRRRKSGSRVDHPPWRANIPEIIAESRDEELLSSSGQQQQQQRQLPLKVSHSCRSRSWQNDEISSDKQSRRRTRNDGSSPSAEASLNERTQQQTKRKARSVAGGLDEVLNGIVDQYSKDGVNCKLTYHRRRSSERQRTESPAVVDKEQQKQRHPQLGQANYALGKSKSTTYVPITKAASNSSCGLSTASGRKKRYRRAQSVNSLRFSNSILERIREYKRCTSSSEDDDAHDVKGTVEQMGTGGSQAESSAGDHLSPCGTLKRNIRMVHSATDIPAENANRPTEEDVYRPKYTLRTSKAGTIVVCEESFRHRKVRRRPRSLTRSNGEMDGEEQQPPPHPKDDVIVFSPERVKTKFEYIGRAEEEEREGNQCSSAATTTTRPDNANRYQREIDNIDKMLEKLKAETEEATGTKSTSKPALTHQHQPKHRRHKSLGSVPLSSSANSKATEDGPLRVNDLLLLSSSIGDGPTSEGEAMTTKTTTPTMDTKAKRISFGRTTFKTGSTDNDYNYSSYCEPGMEINDVDNRVRKTDDDDGEEKEEEDQGPDGTVSVVVAAAAAGSRGECNSDRDKLGGQRRQVRRTRRSLSASDCTWRMNDGLLSSSSTGSESSDGGGSEQDENNRKSNDRRGRSRTTRRKRRRQQQCQTSSHKLIVQGKPQTRYIPLATESPLQTLIYSKEIT